MQIGERLIAEAELNLVGDELATIVDAVQPLIERAWRRRTEALIQLAHERALGGGTATLGAEETLAALAEGRVEHLILDPDHDFPAARNSIDGPRDMRAERAVEAAIATSAQVTSFPSGASTELRDAGGVVALLRY